MFNLLPHTQRKKLETEYKIRIGIIASSLLFATTIIACISLIPSYVVSRGTIADIEDRTTAFKERIAQVGTTPASAALKEVKDLTNVLSKDDSISFSNAINKVVSARPYGIAIYGISINKVVPQNININGVAQTRESLVEYKKRLEEVKEIAKVDLPISALTKSTNLPFNIMIVFKDTK